MKLLVVVDMQNDFVTDALGTKEAQAIVQNVKEKIETEISNGNKVIFTMDTHTKDYLNTQEGKNLPVVHCVKNTKGWEMIPELLPFTKDHTVIEKPSFGSMELAKLVTAEKYDEIELIGLCTDICVISNAMIIKTAVPEIPMCIDASCCSGVTPESHNNALEAMKMCQITIK